MLRPPVDLILVHNLVLMNPVNHESHVRAGAWLHAAPIAAATVSRHAVAGCDVTLENDGTGTSTGTSRSRKRLGSIGACAHSTSVTRLHDDGAMPLH